MTSVDLTKLRTTVTDGNDGIVVQKALSYVEGGRTLDCSDYPNETVKSGHVIVRVKATGVCKPLGVSGSAYEELKETEEYLGILERSVSKQSPYASIVTIGQVNTKALPYEITDKIKTGLSTIKFI